MEVNNENQHAWEAFLNPEILWPNLIIASVYVTTFEILKAGIVDRIRDFYTNGFDENGWRVDPAYESTVLSKNRSLVYASLEWLKEAKAIEDADLVAFDRAKSVRNELVHELHSALFRGLPLDLADRLKDMLVLLDKIERWWIVNLEIPTNPDLNEEEIDEQKIIPGPVMGLRILLDIALGSEEESKRYLKELISLSNQTNS